jgi:hypothetical protein
MKIFFLATLLAISLTGCTQKPGQKKSTRTTTAKPVNTATIAQGTYICWQNSPSSMGGRRALGDMVVKGNTYGGDLYGKGTYTYDPQTRMVRFNGGGFDQRKNGGEWIGFFYEQGAEFLDGSGGKAANAMLIVTSLKDWQEGRKAAWIQQCDLK